MTFVQKESTSGGRSGEFSNDIDAEALKWFGYSPLAETASLTEKLVGFIGGAKIALDKNKFYPELAVSYNKIQEFAQQVEPNQMLKLYQDAFKIEAEAPEGSVKQSFARYLQTPEAENVLTQMIEGLANLDKKAIAHALTRRQDRVETNDDVGQYLANLFQPGFQVAMAATGEGNTEILQRMNAVATAFGGLTEPFVKWHEGNKQLTSEEKSVYYSLWVAGLIGLGLSWSGIQANVELSTGVHNVWTQISPVIYSIVEYALLHRTFRDVIHQAIQGDDEINPLTELFNKRYKNFLKDTVRGAEFLGGVGAIYALTFYFLFRTDFLAVAQQFGGFNGTINTINDIYPFFRDSLANSTVGFLAFFGAFGTELLPLAAENFKRQCLNGGRKAKGIVGIPANIFNEPDDTPNISISHEKVEIPPKSPPDGNNKWRRPHR